MSDDWTDDEFGWREVRAELARIRRRARARWLSIGVISLVLTALVVAKQARSERTFRSTVTLRVIEGQFDPDSAPPTSAQLQDYLWEVALSRSRLLEVMEAHDLYPSLRKIDPLIALDEMRDVLDVKVLRNYFQVERDPDAPPRSARIALSYSHASPEKSIEVARALANLMAEQEAKSRRATAEVALQSVKTSASALDDALVAARSELAQVTYQMSTAPRDEAAGLAVRAIGLRKRILSLEEQKDLASSAVSSLGMQTEVEGKELGLRFEVIDPGRVPRVVVSSSTRLIFIGFFTFLLLLPIASTAVAAYDLRGYDLEDLRRLGLEPFGHIPSFPGYRQATLNDRLRQRTGAS